MAGLNVPISSLRGVGPATAGRLHRIGISSVANLLAHYPIRHEDLRRVTAIAGLRSNQTAVLMGTLQLIQARHGFRRRRMSITEGLLRDQTGTVRLVWFNQPYIATSFKPGDRVWIVGKLATGPYGPQITSPLIERAGGQRLLAGRILPIYRATAGLTQRQLRFLIQQALPSASAITDWLPETLRIRERLAPLADAVRDIHFPTVWSKLERARERLKFNELFLFSLALRRTQSFQAGQRSRTVPFDQPAVKRFVARLPFTLTNGQRRAAWAILNDLRRPSPMHRLLQGDVGSGKTVVAAIAMRNVAAHGLQSALLAPTDILAGQHFATLRQMFGSDARIALLTAGRKEWTLGDRPTRAAILSHLKSGSLDAVIGTHAILNTQVRMPNLALAVIDEQHRFGVEQRHALQSKAGQLVPHLLSMTATPIPRTLTLALYGDLAISALHERPPGRPPVHTRVVPPDERASVYQHVIERSKSGEQTYLVCPLIEESDDLGSAAAIETYERLRAGELAGLRLGLLHGKLPSKTKIAVLEDFADGRIDVLVTTPVVEVGVDVPTATIMVIEDAERFGLAQLHQLRGRVGRSHRPSTCYLMTEQTDSDIRERLEIVASTQDGFALADEDLRRRGPGDVYGVRQSGLPEFKMASLTDVGLIQRAHAAAATLLDADPNLRDYPGLERKAERLFGSIHRE